jgi:hypothetical protein
MGFNSAFKGLKMSETNHPVTVSHAPEEQSSDVSTIVGLYVHNKQALSP